MKPETLERLKKAAGSTAADEEALVADVIEELEVNRADLTAVKAFGRSAGVDLEKLLSAPEETAQAFSRELSDLKAARSALPQSPSADVLHERRLRVGEKIDGLSAKGWPRSFTDPLKSLLAGTKDAPNVVMLGRSAGREDVDAMEFVRLLSDMGGPPPPTGSFAAGREAPRQTPGDGSQTPDQLREEGRQEAKRQQEKQLEAIGGAKAG